MSEQGSEEVQPSPDERDTDATGLYGEAEPDLDEPNPIGDPDADSAPAGDGS